MRCVSMLHAVFFFLFVVVNSLWHFVFIDGVFFVTCRSCIGDVAQVRDACERRPCPNLVVLDGIVPELAGDQKCSI